MSASATQGGHNEV